MEPGRFIGGVIDGLVTTTVSITRVGAFPGSFNPPTVAHLAVAEAVLTQHRLDRVDLIVSREPLAKSVATYPTLEDRVRVLGSIADRLGWLGVVVSDDRLIADMALGYDVVVMGADKWHQIHDRSFYESDDHLRDSLDRLPTIAVVPRAGHEVPEGLTLDIDPAHRLTSSTMARGGRIDLMAPEAAAHARATGAWGVSSGAP